MIDSLGPCTLKAILRAICIQKWLLRLSERQKSELGYLISTPRLSNWPHLKGDTHACTCMYTFSCQTIFSSSLWRMSFLGLGVAPTQENWEIKIEEKRREDGRSERVSKEKGKKSRSNEFWRGWWNEQRTKWKQERKALSNIFRTEWSSRNSFSEMCYLQWTGCRSQRIGLDEKLCDWQCLVYDTEWTWP